MQKKLFALVTVIAMTLSMFAGSVMAKPRDIEELTLSTTEVISSAPHTEYQLVSGVIPASSKASADFKVRVVGEQAGTIYDEIDAIGGQFRFYLPTNLAAQDIRVMALRGSNIVAQGTIAVRYQVTTTPERLKFAFTGEQQPVAITGRVTNSKGEPVANKSVKLEGEASGTSYFTGIKTYPNGEFGSVVLQWLAAESLELRVGSDETDTIAHTQGEVAPKEANLEVTPEKAVRTIAQAKFAVTGTGFGPEVKDVSFSLLRDSQPVSSEDAVALPQDVRTDAAGNMAASFTWTPTQAGTYTLIASTGNYCASTTIVVTSPTSYNLINSSKLEELIVGVNELIIGPSDIHLVHYLTSSSFTNEFVYTVYIDGKLAHDLISDQGFAKLATGEIAVPATKLGTKTVKIIAYKLADKNNPEAKPAFERTITAKVVGWDATLKPAQLTVNQAHNVTLVVKDEHGKAINNAEIEIEGYTTHTAGATNVQDGTYIFKDVKLTAVAPKAVKVYQGERLMAVLDLNVVGQQVYKVSADVTTLLQGQGEDVQLTVTHNGNAVMPWLVKWIYADGTSDTAYPSHIAAGVSKVNITAAKPGPLTVRVENIDGTLCGEIKLAVVAPKLVLLEQGAANLTNNLKTTVKFKVVDPRNNSVLQQNLAVVPNHLSRLNLYDADGGVIGTTLLGSEEHSLTLLPQALESDWSEARTNNEIVAVGFKIGNAEVDGILAVKEASLTSSPEKILIGAKNNLTLTYLDANGQPLANKQIAVGDAKLGKTDAKGQVIYPVSVVTAPTVEVKADTDVDSAKVPLTIRLAFDTEAPQVTYKVVDNRATFTITDNLRIVRIKIDGKEVDFWPGPTYEFTKTLRPGVNKVHIKAQDTNNNVLDETIKIEYTPEPDSVVLRGNQVKRQGDFSFVQARQFEELGAQFVWRAGPKVAAFTLGRNRVEVIIGSMIAKVNGVPVAMPAAPFLADNRTYIPLRFVSETLGLKVHWSAGDVITISNK